MQIQSRWDSESAIGTEFGVFTKSTDFRYFVGVTSLQNSAFRYYAGASFVLPPNVKTIGNYVLRYSSGAKSITYVEVGEKVTSIGEYFINGFTALATVVVRAVTPPTLGFAAFKNGTTKHNNDYYKIYVPDDSVNTYKTTTRWSDYASRILPLSQLSE